MRDGNIWCVTRWFQKKDDQLIFANKLWTDNSSRQFLADEYPHFLPLYDGFTLRVQRIDALRYFLMRHFGGVYIDLDNVSVVTFMGQHDRSTKQIKLAHLIYRAALNHSNRFATTKLLSQMGATEP